MTNLTTEQLKQMRESGQDFALVNVLSSEDFRQGHIPASENVPLHADDFLERMEQIAGGKDKPVVVYCASDACDASPQAAQKLEEAGFTKVYDYTGGMEAWRSADQPIEAAT